VEELHNIVEVIHEEDGQGEMNTIVMGERKSVDGEKSYRYIVRLLGLERKNLRCQMLTDFSERNGLNTNT
jgi:hypothetical protein